MGWCVREREERKREGAGLGPALVFPALQKLFSSILKRRKEGENQNKIRVCVFLKVEYLLICKIEISILILLVQNNFGFKMWFCNLEKDVACDKYMA